MKKICFIAQFPPPMHGLSKAVDTLYNSELSKEFEFEKVNITDNKKFIQNLIAISKSKADLFYFTISQTKGGNLRDLIIFKLLELQHKKCLIHLHGGYYRQLVDHDISSWQRKANYKEISKLSGAVVLGKSLVPMFKGMLPEEKIFIVPNCVDDQYLMSESEFADKCNSVGVIDRKILYLSNFLPSKGYRDVLEMAKIETERQKKRGKKMFHFDFAGKFYEKYEEDYFHNFIMENDLGDIVSFHGIVTGNEKRKLLKESDIFVLLSRNEGQPISILEAMGNGMMVITTDVGGIPDEVTSGGNGIVVDANNIDCNCIMEQLETSMINLEQIRRNNRTKIINYYTETQYIENMKSIFYMS